MSVSAEHLSYRFGIRRALDDVSFSVQRGEIVGVLGGNGAGKSTLFRVLCGLLSPLKGTATLAGFSLASHRAGARAATGYVAQRFGLYEDLTVSENLRFYGRAYGLNRGTAAERMSSALTRFELEARANDTTGALSHGWKQRVAMACALLHQPRVLLLDEATAGLDPGGRKQAWRVIEHEAANGSAVLFSTHHPDEAERCSRALWLEEGRLVGDGSYYEAARDLF